MSSLQLGRNLPQRDRVDGFEEFPHGLIRAVLALGPQPECGQEFGGQRDEVTAGLVVHQLGRPCLDLPPRPGKQLVERAHLPSLRRGYDHHHALWSRSPVMRWPWCESAWMG